MPAYLSLWNPAKYDWADLSRLVEQIERGEPAIHGWGVGRRTQLEPGSDFYLMQTGRTAGIRARGITLTQPERRTRFDDSSREHMRLDVRFIDIQDRDELPALPRSVLQNDPVLSSFHWAQQVGGVELPAPIATHLAALWSQQFQGRAEQHPLDASYHEGTAILQLRLHRHRERRCREDKLAAYARNHDGRLACEVCTLDLTSRFGPAARAVAEVHHRDPFRESDGPRVTRLEDLAVVCANCHRFIHSRWPALAVEEAGQMLPLLGS